MKDDQRRVTTHRLLQPLLCAALGAACMTLAHAGIGAPPLAPDSGGNMSDLSYGSSGNVFELQPMLFITGLGGAKDPASVVTLNTDLEFSFSLKNFGSSLASVDYVVHNRSAVASFSDLRFMVFANPDGDQTQFLDRMSETWGAAVAGDPVRRESNAFTANAFDSIKGRFVANNNLTDGGPSAACAAAAGCDAVVGLQWNAATLAPGESFVVRVGLSDDGQHLSSRWLTATAVNAADTVLTLSGTGFVTAVPEPASGWMLLGGMGALAALSRRRLARPAA